ncbi:hypothetical protein A2U01_0058454, partial [Trifolium medium]|nr:hypothetical protein [Trifolium medium]
MVMVTVASIFLFGDRLSLGGLSDHLIGSLMSSMGEMPTVGQLLKR